MKYFSVHLIILCCFVFAIKTNAQTALPVPRNINKAYQKQTRSADGKPGKNYWQNRADYNLEIQFNPETRVLQGLENIEYSNNSFDTLTQIVFKLYPNLYNRGAERMMKIQEQDVSEGLHFDKIEADKIDVKDTVAQGTNFFVKHVQILPKTKAHFTIVYHYTLNQGSHIRTGEIEPGADFIAYFFPRIAVYDDIDGWNLNPYIGTQEFYNDFCHFTINISVPKNYVVWCTGNLSNVKDVLQEKYIQRLQNAEQSNEVTTIIDSIDIAKNDITVDKPMLTWQYEADDVTDVVFAISNHYIWQASSLVVDSATKRRTRVDAVFAPKHKDYFDVIHFARKTVEAMSFVFPQWAYPYPHETVFDGLDQMEYPMMVNDNPVEDKEGSIELTDHEIFHTMFPFYMGINETKYAWMDEGWASIGEWLISPLIDTTIQDHYGILPYEQAAGTEVDLPIITLSTEQTGTSYFLNSYPKPAFGYLYVKDMLGDKVFTKALHNYISQWHGKHPMPLDFFNCMNEGAKQNMNWFWKRWFFDSGVPNLGITKVTKAGNRYLITVANKGGKPVPVDLTFHFADHSIQTIHSSIACWKNDVKDSTFSFSTNKKINNITLGSLYTPDTDKSDNVYE
ncbi:MAG: M1 family metallopeptidase, partial [Bacteroidota bacterium]|nr:M1 family metallopeptidase [Bacteroidota bacterium]